MISSTPPPSQKSGARPISFVLDDGALGLGVEWVPLVIRPEDLTRTEPVRAAVHQTLGRGVIGWSDSFGPGLPSINISGNTGWRQHSTYGSGEAEFLRLNDLIARRFPEMKQRAIDIGRDPSLVKLIFVDTLNSAIWSVEPQSFVLRRSKSRPLLFQYQISMQAIDTRAMAPTVDIPFLGDVAAGINALDNALLNLGTMAGQAEVLVNDAFRTITQGWAPVGATVRSFAEMSNQIFSAVSRVSKSVQGGISSVSNELIIAARDMAIIGTNVFRTVSAVTDIPQSLMFEAGRVASAYMEVYCIFRNSLRPRRLYSDYENLFGASNCSSTTGGRQPSTFQNHNVFELISNTKPPLVMNDAANRSIAMLRANDPVTYRLSPAELQRHLSAIVNGFGGVSV